jgi:membrane protease YdiL (CAAX protease family)
VFRTENFEAFIAPARRYPQIWRLILGIISGLIVYSLGAAIVAFALSVFLFDIFASQDPSLRAGWYAIQTTILPLLETGQNPRAMALILATFIPMALGALAMAAWHWRGLASLLGRRERFGEYFLKGALVIVGLNACYFLYDALFSDNTYLPNLPFSTWAVHLLWAVPLLFIQITAEELIFRGYLQQQLAARFKGFVWWMILPSAVFAVGHFDPEIDTILAWSSGFAPGLLGVIAADLTRLTGSLAAAMGLHFANNFFSLLIIGVPDKLSGLALYHTPFDMDAVEVMQGFVLIDIAILILIWIIARRVLR